jgi:hypothetical protein
VSDLQPLDAQNSNRHAAIVIGVLIAVIGVAFFLGFVPGTAPWQDRIARNDIAQMLVDPGSAEFRSVRASKGKVGDQSGVCGEVNGKNRMGAYAGYAAFFWHPESRYRYLRPQDEITQTELKDAEKNCADMLELQIDSGRFGDDNAVCRSLREKQAAFEAQKLELQTYNSLC